MRRGYHRKFGKERNQRANLYTALATALIDHGKIKTTQAKAKSLSAFMGKITTRAVKGDLASRRLLLQYLGEKAVKKLITDIGPKMKDRKGGYTRVINLGQRRSDGAQMAQIEFVK